MCRVAWLRVQDQCLTCEADRNPRFVIAPELGSRLIEPRSGTLTHRAHQYRAREEAVRRASDQDQDSRSIKCVPRETWIGPRSPSSILRGLCLIVTRPSDRFLTGAVLMERTRLGPSLFSSRILQFLHIVRPSSPFFHISRCAAGWCAPWSVREADSGASFPAYSD
jgi:hypothetical protein